ncbi:hypothetical protein VNI00_015615 [Paramarasmius palmivorus]|uniref:F-box domain-containing protein n=1 Tax=Paramarasmius palmivorus TaxID=297713 RepID=A0AAW0BJ08_9AGAR
MDKARPHTEEQTHIQNFPSEILSEIFHNVDAPKVQGFICRTHLQNCCIDSVGLRLGAVCRQWRNIVLSSPALWASIQVDITNNSYRTEMLDALSETLLRSASSMLMIVVHLNEDIGRGPGGCPEIVDAVTSPSQPDPSSPHFILAALLRNLFEQSERIRHLVAAGNPRQSEDFEFMLLPILSHFNGRFNDMVHLNLNLPVDSTDQYELNMLSKISRLIECAPSIRELGLRLCYPRIDCLPQFTCSLMLLTQLHIRDTTVDCMWYFLRMCPNIESALITLGPILEEEEMRFRATISILYPFITRAKLIIDTLATKPLYYTVPDLAVFRPFIIRNGAGLQVLALDQFPTSPYEVERIFEHVPELRKLVIIETNWIDRRIGLSNKNHTATIDLMKALKDTHTLPKLKELRLHVNREWEGTAFEDMVQARRSTDVHLEIRDEIMDRGNEPDRADDRVSSLGYPWLRSSIALLFILLSFPFKLTYLVWKLISSPR